MKQINLEFMIYYKDINYLCPVIILLHYKYDVIINLILENVF